MQCERSWHVAGVALQVAIADETAQQSATVVSRFEPPQFERLPQEDRCAFPVAGNQIETSQYMQRAGTVTRVNVLCREWQCREQSTQGLVEMAGCPSRDRIVVLHRDVQPHVVVGLKPLEQRPESGDRLAVVASLVLEDREVLEYESLALSFARGGEQPRRLLISSTSLVAAALVEVCEPEIVQCVRLFVWHVRRVKRRRSLLQQTMGLVGVEIAQPWRGARVDLPLTR